jgi:hypothetical protein
MHASVDFIISSTPPLHPESLNIAPLPSTPPHNIAKTPPTTPIAPITNGTAVFCTPPFELLVGVPNSFSATLSIALTSPLTAVCTACGTFFVYQLCVITSL